uniref:Uncharacterized protein n=1 Tax=Arundo donax TaxID=35708 RepID=A0A0A9B1P4_ARUDO
MDHRMRLQNLTILSTLLCISSLVTAKLQSRAPLFLTMPFEAVSSVLLPFWTYTLLFNEPRCLGS